MLPVFTARFPVTGSGFLAVPRLCLAVTTAIPVSGSILRDLPDIPVGHGAPRTVQHIHFRFGVAAHAFPEQCPST